VCRVALLGLLACALLSCKDGRTGNKPPSKCGDGCSTDKVCVEELGCVDCIPGSKACASSDRTATCDESGRYVPGVECNGAAREVCDDGVCREGCTAAALHRSNIGCEYWPVDLPQYCDLTGFAGICERDDDFAVLVTNLNAFSVHVTVERNDAAFGQPAQLGLVLERDVPARAVEVLRLPQREVDGSNNTDPDNFSGLSARAYRLTSDGPVVAYQLNTLAETDSIDASALIPTASLDTRYRAITVPTLVIDMAGLKARNRAFVTIVGTEAGTHVKVTAGGHVVAGGGVADTPRGGMIEATLGPFEVLHLAGDFTGGITGQLREGDLSTTIVESDAPVAVFSGHLCSTVTGPMGSPQPPMGQDGCCCDHLEEQVPPTTALGASFAVTRSPRRSMTTYVEPDVYRIVADRPDTQITTNLPAPWNSFTVGPDDVVELWAQTDFVLTATGPVLLAQLLVGQNWGAGTGDPSMTYMPPIDQARDDYVFLVPQTYAQNFVVVGRERDVPVRIDGNPVGAACQITTVGVLAGKTYESMVCPLAAGAHTLDADRPVTLIEYGYGDTGSIAYVGGTDYEIINPIL
jgi:hypothetical protein